VIVALYVIAGLLVLACGVQLYFIGRGRKPAQKPPVVWGEPHHGKSSAPTSNADILNTSTGEPINGWIDLGYTKPRAWTAMEALNAMGAEFDSMFPTQSTTVFPYNIANLMRGPARVLIARSPA
jgi:hypothetical protein